MLNHQYLWILKKQTCYFDIRYPRNWITFGFQSCWNAKFQSFGIKRYVFISSLAHTKLQLSEVCTGRKKNVQVKRTVNSSNAVIRLLKYLIFIKIGRRNRSIFSMCDFLCTFFSAGTHLRQL